MTPAEQLEKIYRMIPGMIVRRDQLYRIVSEKLEQAGICDVNMNSVDAAEKRYIQQYFRGEDSFRFSLRRLWTAIIGFLI